MDYRNHKIILTWDDCVKIKNKNKQGISLADSFRLVMVDSKRKQISLFNNKNILEQWEEDNNAGGIYGPDVFNQMVCEVETELICESYKLLPTEQKKTY